MRLTIASADNELVLEDEIGELLVPAEATESVSPAFDDTVSAQSINQTASNDKQVSQLASNIEELIASTAIEQALADDEVGAAKPAPNFTTENTEVTRLILAIENLTSALAASNKKSQQQDPQNQFATAVHWAKQKNNPHLAARWFRKAAMQGHARAQFYLGVFFSKGEGLPKSYFHAYSWLSIAASQNLPEAVAAKKQLEGHLTAQESAAALKYAAELFEQMQVPD